MIVHRWPYEIDKARLEFAGQIRVKRHGWSRAMAGFDYRVLKYSSGIVQRRILHATICPTILLRYEAGNYEGV